MQRWNYLRFALHLRHLELASAIAAEMGTRGIHEQPLKAGAVLLKAYFDPSRDIGWICRIDPAALPAAIVPSL